MAKKKTKKITYQITFECSDMDAFVDSYPNYHYNYSTFQQFVKSSIVTLKDSLKDFDSLKISAKKVANDN